MAIEVEGIILKSFNYGEHHKIVKVLTENQGVIGVFVQNANKVNTKKSALVQPLTCARFNLKPSTNANSDLYYLYNGDVIDYYLNLKFNYEDLTYFYFMIELILKGTSESENSVYIYRMLKNFLDAANNGYSAYLLSLIFQLKMMHFIGIEPVMDCCAVCQSKEHIVTLSVRQGGLVCAKCYQSNDPILIDAALIPIVRALYKVDINQLPDVELEEELLEPIEQFLDAYYDSYAGFHLQTKKFIKEL